MSKRGFLLGKFLPPHNGHLFLCETAASLCDQLTVLVCSLKGEPIDGELRYGWMKHLLPHVRVKHYGEDVPQEPSQHPDFWRIWREICVDAHPERIDMVFGSEPYVIRLASELDARPVMIDPERLAFPVSGTAVRNDPAGHWDMLPGPVRSYYQKRVVLVGAESTGKSTLARELATALQTRYVPEYGRVFDAYRSSPWQSSHFEAIEHGQRAMRLVIAPRSGPVLIEDTDELVTRVWEEALTGLRPARMRPARLADLYLLLDTDLQWQNDGTRYHEQHLLREQFQASMQRELKDAGARFRIVRGLGGHRLDKALNEIQSVLR